MKKRLTIALVAHDNRKADMVEWVKHNAELLSHHHLVCTGTTGRLIKEAFDELNIPADVTCMNSVRWGEMPKLPHWWFVIKSIWLSF